jgi:hypothetical protein
MSEYIEREALKAVFEEDGHLSAYVEEMIDSIPSADVRPALWTDGPIIGTEFMTHNQGQSGFEIHFRTDDKGKYAAVQSECRRQIDHAKPAAEVRPVVLCEDCEMATACSDDREMYCTLNHCYRGKTYFCADGRWKNENHN